MDNTNKKIMNKLTGKLEPFVGMTVMRYENRGDSKYKNYIYKIIEIKTNKKIVIKSICDSNISYIVSFRKDNTWKIQGTNLIVDLVND